MDLTGITQTLARAPAFTRLSDSLAGGPTRVTAGVADAAKAVAIAAVALGRQDPILVLTSREDRADRLAEELAVWLSDTLPVLAFPERDALPYERLTPATDTLRDRLQVLAALQERERAIIVACGLAVAQRTISPGEARDALRRLQVAGELDPETFLRDLLALGYNMEPVVLEPGQAGRRGGIIDVFPPTADFPVRIEFVGREVESLRLFDPATQRSVRSVDEITIGPSREILAGRLDMKPLSSLNLNACKPDARERFEDELALLRGGDVPQGIDFYVPFLARSTLLDHLPEDALVIIDDETDIGAALEEALDLAATTRTELEEAGEIPRGLPPPLEPWPDLRRALAAHPKTLRLSRWATEEDQDVIRLPFLPPLAYAGQLRKLVNELAARAPADARVTVVSQQGQRLAELLAEEGAGAAVTERVTREPGRLNLVQGSLTEGWRYSDTGLALSLVTDTEVFGFVKQRRVPARKAINREAFLAELTPGTHVVHIDHG
ncbi:MAG TPA: hypothetical protein VLS25_04355, partial [Dehalococcoidia bacterium]|nr:hypothetical protein [Dehalococcoidia bacterium]